MIRYSWFGILLPQYGWFGIVYVIVTYWPYVGIDEDTDVHNLPIYWLPQKHFYIGLNEAVAATQAGLLSRPLSARMPWRLAPNSELCSWRFQDAGVSAYLC